mmetsp:Transcript_10315/g.21865  ORF Transcript_10315/g.21865 Transcript_10315/m.21865 type:complete len:89 (+) Transcript_10315:43-309(+)
MEKKVKWEKMQQKVSKRAKGRSVGNIMGTGSNAEYGFRLSCALKSTCIGRPASRALYLPLLGPPPIISRCDTSQRQTTAACSPQTNGP